MKIKKTISILILLLLIPAALSAQNYSMGFDYYRLKPALIAKIGTVDFSATTSYQNTDMYFRIPVNAIDTLRVSGSSMLVDMKWNLNYSFRKNWEINVAGMAFYDANEGVFRYGAGDTKIGLKFAAPNVESQFNYAVEGYMTVPTGFDDGDRIVRNFAIGKTSWGVNFYTDLLWQKWSAKISGGYFNAAGRAEKISDTENTFWYSVLNGVTGISPRGEVINSAQSHIGFGVGRDFFFGSKLFAEYVSNNIHVNTGDGKSLGNIAGGISVLNREGLKVNVGFDMPLGTQRPGMGFFGSIRMNGIIGGRRIIVTPTPTLAEEEPTLAPGAKPFFRREGLVYSRVRSPITDTIFIIDATPSMLGRNSVGERGEEVARGVIDFIQILIDSTQANSNVSLITFNDEVTSLSWRNIDDAKKEEIKNSVRDVPDEISAKADEIENRAGTYQWQELLEQAILKGYEELDAFQKSDYNRIHLKRVIVFSDGIDESTRTHNLRAGFDSIVRRYQITRDDYRYFYFVHTNPKTEGAKINDRIITFVEQEDGKLFRSTDIANVGEEFVGDFSFNRIEGTSGLRYQSQITKIAVLDFNTAGQGNFRNPLIDAFKSIFEFNEYFVVSPQNEVRNSMARAGVTVDQKLDQRKLMQIGRGLGVDYVVYGEVVDLRTERGKGLHIPYFFGLPKTEMSIEVAIQLINVSDGTLAYVDRITAQSSHREGVSFFPTSRENKMNQLSGLDIEKLQIRLMENWARRLRDSMFEDRTIIIEQQ